jgi:hypothetical protein
MSAAKAEDDAKQAETAATEREILDAMIPQFLPRMCASGIENRQE